MTIRAATCEVAIMYDEDRLLPLSGLQHMVFCERQWALIHLEQQWEENRLTAEGRVMHERADEPSHETRGDVRVVRGLSLRSLRLGLSGRADIVEFHRLPGVGADSPASTPSVPPTPDGAPIAGLAGLWRPFPVEYKRGRPKADDCDKVQLCAQGMCLEEMRGVPVPGGALFYGTTRRRLEVPFDAPLRDRVETIAARMHELFDKGRTPPAIREKKCEKCSLLEICLPGIAGRGKSARRYLGQILADRFDDGVPGSSAEEP